MSEWIEWKWSEKKPKPEIDKSAKLSVRFRSGELVIFDELMPNDYDCWCWDDRDCLYDIVAYKVEE